MLTLTLTEEDIMRLKMIEVDRDAEDALAFVRERIIPELQRREGMRMRNHFDGGKGSML